MKIIYNGNYCRLKEQYIQLTSCQYCKWCAFKDTRVYCAYPTSE